MAELVVVCLKAPYLSPATLAGVGRVLALARKLHKLQRVKNKINKHTAGLVCFARFCFVRAERRAAMVWCGVVWCD